MSKWLNRAFLVPTLFVAASGCLTNLPGDVYRIQLPEPPKVDECVALAHAISTTVDVTSSHTSYQPVRPGSSDNQCLVQMTGNNAPRPCLIAVSISSRDPTIYLSVTESKWGRFTTVSTSSAEMSRRIRALLIERYPNATINDLHPVQGFFAP
jgi:hypothetical protein